MSVILQAISQPFKKDAPVLLTIAGVVIGGYAAIELFSRLVYPPPKAHFLHGSWWTPWIVNQV